MNEFGGPGSLLDGDCWMLRGEMQEEHGRNLILRRSDDDDDGASRYPTSTGVVQSSSSSHGTIWTGGSSTGNQKI